MFQERRRVYTTEERYLERQLCEWTIASHLWGDGLHGSKICKWCGVQIHSGQNFPSTVCAENPKIKEVMP